MEKEGLLNLKEEYEKLINQIESNVIAVYYSNDWIEIQVIKKRQVEKIVTFAMNSIKTFEEALKEIVTSDEFKYLPVKGYKFSKREEKLQKEIEKREREIQKQIKEEEELQRKLKEAFEKGQEAETQKYQEEINKLQQVIEDSKRAVSQAQMTKVGHVYVISNIGSFGENIYKIGMTRRLEPLDRVDELGDASVPFRFDVHAMIKSDNAPELENKLHELFKEKSVNRINYRKEFPIDNRAYDFKIGNILIEINNNMSKK